MKVQIELELTQEETEDLANGITLIRTSENHLVKIWAKIQRERGELK